MSRGSRDRRAAEAEDGRRVDRVSAYDRALAALRSVMPLDGWLFLVVCPILFLAWMVFAMWEERDWQRRGCPPARGRWPSRRPTKRGDRWV